MYGSYLVKPLKISCIKGEQIAYAMTTHEGRYPGIMHFHASYLMGQFCQTLKISGGSCNTGKIA